MNSGARVVNVILGNPLGHDGNDEESIRHLINPPSHSESSTGSCSPPREILVIGALTESENQRQHDEEARQRQRADEAEHQRLEEEGRRELERNRELQARGRQVHDDFLQADSGGQGVFATPQQNLTVAAAFMESLVPMLGKDNVATPIATRVRALVAAAAVQQQEQIAPSRTRTRAASHAASSRA